jgi:putative endonuclease
MTNNQRFHVLYTGITGDLPHRVFGHKDKLVPGFTSRYDFTASSIAKSFVTRRRDSAEKEIKGWVRSKKIKLIESMNPHWHDLAADWEDLYKACRPHSRQCARSFGLAAAQDDVKAETRTA